MNHYPRVFLKNLEKIMHSDFSKEVSPRGSLTKEVLGTTMVIDCRKCLYDSPQRNLNFFFLIAENMWYWSGRNTTEMPSSFVKNYRNFSDNNIHQGAYGPMLLEQIRHVINCLSSDKDSRQAVISLWRPNPMTSKDTPCTLNFHFMIRDGKLDMFATMRSNDLVWGSNYDVPSFSMINIAIASMLNVLPGSLYLTANSLHVYEKHFELSEHLLKEHHNFDFYPAKLEMITEGASSLSEHMKCLEKIISAYYLNVNGSYAWHLGDSNGCPSFYKQFIYMIDLFFSMKNDNNKVSKDSIVRLCDINSPFGYIYYDRHQNLFN